MSKFIFFYIFYIRFQSLLNIKIKKFCICFGYNKYIYVSICYEHELWIYMKNFSYMNINIYKINN